MRKVAVAVLLSLGVAAQSGAQQNSLARFDGGIGVDPIATFAGTVSGDGTFQVFTDVLRNIVRGIPGSALSWRIGDLKADIAVDGRVHAEGHGLVLASGSAIGTNNGDESVFVSLTCSVDNGFQEFTTNPEGVPLEPNGDFRIDDTLNGVPAACNVPVLLIRSHRTGRWLAAGVTRGNDK